MCFPTKALENCCESGYTEHDKMNILWLMKTMSRENCKSETCSSKVCRLSYTNVQIYYIAFLKVCNNSLT